MTPSSTARRIIAERIRSKVAHHGTQKTRSPTHPQRPAARQAGAHAKSLDTPRRERTDRDRAVDVARLAALVVVMFGHCALLLATIDAGGLHIGNLLGELPAIAPLTWVVQVMPLFFLAGGAAGAYGWRGGTPWGTWLFTRAQRLCRPVFWYLAAWAVGSPRGPRDARRGVRGRARARVRRAPVVPRRVPRGARLRTRR